MYILASFHNITHLFTHFSLFTFISNTQLLHEEKTALLYNNTNSRLVKLLRFTSTTTSRMITTKASSSNAQDDPQCNLVGNVDLDSLSLNQQSETRSEFCSPSQLESLSDDLLLNVLVYCGPNEVEENIKLISRRLQ